MENQKPESNSGSSAIVPPKPANSAAKFYAVIVALVIIAAAFGVLYATKSPAPSKTTAVSATLGNVTQTLSVGQTYSFTIKASGSFNNITVWWGDGATSFIKYSGSTSVVASHQYTSQGDYFVLYQINYPSSTYNGLIPLSVGYPASSNVFVNQSFAFAELVSNSTPPVITNPAIFGPGADLVYQVSYSTPSNSSLMVVNLTVNIYKGSDLISTNAYPLVYAITASGPGFILPQGTIDLYLNNLAQGYYTVQTYVTVGTLAMTMINGTLVPTGTANVTNVSAQTTVSYTDIPIFDSVTPYAQAASTTFFDALPNAVGGYTTLDPAISFYTASNEILLNTLLQLDQYNGTSTTSFIPELASSLPTIANGGENNNTYNYTYKDNYMGPVTIKVLPGENYTFHIRSGIRDQFGNTITAYDVYFEIVRDMLFSVSSPGTGGYLIAEYFFNNYSSPGFTATYQGIMPNLTYSNTSDTFTIHFAHPMPTALVYQLFAASGTFVESATWLTQHGSGINFSPAGFNAYRAEGNSAGYNTYVQNHIDANGPYEVSLVSPAQFVVLTANPNFQGLPYYPAAQSAKTVIMQYTSSDSTAWLEFSSGQAQDVQGVIPQYWNDTLALVKQGKAITSQFPTLSIYFYNFNLNVNTSMLSTIDKKANLPSAFFVNHDVRLAFAYAYNYTEYFNNQIGNKLFNATFQVPYAGMLVPGLPAAQNISALNALGIPVPYTNLVKAAQYWGDFWNSSARTQMGFTGTPAKPLYNGNALDVPIFVLSQDPPDEAGATTWVQMLQTFIPGLDGGSQDVVQTSETNIFLTYAVPQGDPMPISWGGWAPDYPYPTDYLSAMFLPSTTSTYQNANSWNSSYVAGITTKQYGPNSYADPAEASALNNITMYYDRGVANETNAAVAYSWFQKMNEASINMTMEVYLGQVNQIWIWDSIANKTLLQQWQQNVMIGGGAEIMYNYVVYNS
jgi:hypothetical protein